MPPAATPAETGDLPDPSALLFDVRERTTRRRFAPADPPARDAARAVGDRA